jgi:hypothetical protein
MAELVLTLSVNKFINRATLWSDQDITGILTVQLSRDNFKTRLVLQDFNSPA